MPVKLWILNIKELGGGGGGVEEGMRVKLWICGY